MYGIKLDGNQFWELFLSWLVVRDGRRRSELVGPLVRLREKDMFRFFLPSSESKGAKFDRIPSNPSLAAWQRQKPVPWC